MGHSPVAGIAVVADATALALQAHMVAGRPRERLRAEPRGENRSDAAEIPTIPAEITTTWKAVDDMGRGAPAATIR